MRARPAGLLALLPALVAGAAGATPPPEEPAMTEPAATLEDHAADGTFEVRVAGPVIAAPVTGRRCAWFDAVVGWGEEGALDSWQSLGVSEVDLALQTPRGPLTLSWRKLRPHVTPEVRTYAPGAPDAPAPVAAWLAEHGGPAAVRIHCLEPDRTYFARVATETYHLPPRPPDFEPEARSNTTLVLSDAPFDDRPDRPLSPAYRGWSY